MGLKILSYSGRNTFCVLNNVVKVLGLKDWPK